MGEDKPFTFYLTDQATGTAVDLSGADLLELFFVNRKEGMFKRYHSDAEAGVIGHVDINAVGEATNYVHGLAVRADSRAWPQGAFDCEWKATFPDDDFPDTGRMEMGTIADFGRVNYTASRLL